MRPRVLPDRSCEECGASYARSRRPSGVLETITAFQRRRLCGTACLYARRRRHPVDQVKFCAEKKCGKPLVRHRTACGTLERAADFGARRFCNDECWYKSQRKVQIFAKKRCFHCQSFLRPRTRKNGITESPYHLGRRNFCDMVCFRLWQDEHWGENSAQLLKKMKRALWARDNE